MSCAKVVGATTSRRVKESKRAEANLKGLFMEPPRNSQQLVGLSDECPQVRVAETNLCLALVFAGRRIGGRGGRVRAGRHWQRLQVVFAQERVHAWQRLTVELAPVSQVFVERL